MAEARNREPASEQIKGHLRNLPLVYPLGKWIYRRFRGPDPTIQQHILKAVGSKPSVFFVQVGSNDGVQGDPIHDLIVERGVGAAFSSSRLTFFFNACAGITETQNGLFLRTSRSALRKEARSFITFRRKPGLNSTCLTGTTSWALSIKRISPESAGRTDAPLHRRGGRRVSAVAGVLDRNAVDAIDLIHIDTEGFDYKGLVAARSRAV